MARFLNERDIYVIGIVLPVLATFAVVARVLVRWRNHTRFGVDDYTIFVALGLLWGSGCILVDGAAQNALGTHTPIDPNTGHNINTPVSLIIPKLYYAFLLVFIPTIGLIKISIVLLYRRIFISQTFRRLSSGLLMMLILWCVAFFFARTFACGTHISAAWTSSAQLIEYCGAYQAVELGFGVSDVFTDIMVLASPIPFIWRLQLRTAQKFAVTGVFLLGLLSTAAGTVRLAFLVIDGYETKPGSRDVSGTGTVVLAWSQVEAGIGIIAACLPTLRPILHGKSPESIIDSGRSILSLQSLGPSTSSGRPADKQLTATSAPPA